MFTPGGESGALLVALRPLLRELAAVNVLSPISRPSSRSGKSKESTKDELIDDKPDQDLERTEGRGE